MSANRDKGQGPGSPSRFAIPVLLALVSCAEPGPAMTVRFQLEAPPRPDVEMPLRDGLGIFNLESWPLFVALRIEGPDMEPLLSQWPAELADWQDGVTEIEFEPEVPAGKSRVVTAVAFRYSEGKLYGYRSPLPDVVLDVHNDSPASLDLVLQETGYGTVLVTLPAGLSQLWLVDATDMVRLDRRTPIEDFVKLPRVPYGRPMRLAVVPAKGKAELVELPPFTLDESTPTLSLDLSK
ncbi:MAG: hypothetical protein FJ109_09580 [Deltaproteobacteria bacterium]|nr:hypothetical protein [Deltaproteobacteria bacterium]